MTGDDFARDCVEEIVSTDREGRRVRLYPGDWVRVAGGRILQIVRVVRLSSFIRPDAKRIDSTDEVSAFSRTYFHAAQLSDGSIGEALDLQPVDVRAIDGSPLESQP